MGDATFQSKLEKPTVVTPVTLKQIICMKQ